MADESESLKEEMAAALRGDMERARLKRNEEPAPEPEPQPEPERRKSFLQRLRG